MLRLASTPSMPVLPLAAGTDTPEDGLLEQVGPLAGAHVLVLGGRGAVLLGGLVRRGCLAATLLRRNEKPDSGGYDIVLVPHVADDECLDGLVHQARRALVPTGEFVARVDGDATEFRALRLARRLRLNGLVAVRVAPLAGAALVRASLPAFGMVGRA
jgi:hypothetical protein